MGIGTSVGIGTRGKMPTESQMEALKLPKIRQNPTVTF